MDIRGAGPDLKCDGSVTVAAIAVAVMKPALSSSDRHVRALNSVVHSAASNVLFGQAKFG
jgi:hypothetical protein